jgi:hypothetical protein
MKLMKLKRGEELESLREMREKSEGEPSAEVFEVRSLTIL